MMAAAVALISGSGLTTAVCAALEVSRASVHRHRRALMNPLCAVKQRPSSVRVLLESERDQVLAHLQTPGFVDQTLAPDSGPRLWPQTPTEVFATLPGEGVCLWRVRTMYLDPFRAGRGRGTPPPAPPPGPSKARTAGRGTQPEPASGLTGGGVVGVSRSLAWPGSNCRGDSLKRRTPN